MRNKDGVIAGGVAVGAEDYAAVAAQHARDLILLLDSEGTVLWASPSHRDVVKIDPQSMIGRRNLEFVHPDDRARAREAFARRMSTRKSETIEIRLLRGDGGAIEVESVGVPIVSADGRADQLVVVARDIGD